MEKIRGTVGGESAVAERERVRRINMKKKPRRKISLKSIRSFNHPNAAGETNKTNPLPHIYLSIYIYIETKRGRCTYFVISYLPEKQDIGD